MGPLSVAPIENCTIALSNRHTGETSSLTACSLVTSILEKLAQRSYDAVLCHIRMPGLNGPAFYRAIEQRAPAFLSRVLVVLGDILSPETQPFSQQTAAPIREKPFTVEAIRKIVRHILQAAEGEGNAHAR